MRKSCNGRLIEQKLIGKLKTNAEQAFKPAHLKWHKVKRNYSSKSLDRNTLNQTVFPLTIWLSCSITFNHIFSFILWSSCSIIFNHYCFSTSQNIWQKNLLSSHVLRSAIRNCVGPSVHLSIGRSVLWLVGPALLFWHFMSGFCRSHAEPSKGR